MWLITDQGFYSIVQKPGDAPDYLTVRARVAKDLDNLRTFVPELGRTVTGVGTDYPFRARVSKRALGAGLARMAQSLYYDNFKEQVGRTQGPKRMNVYGQVWANLRQLERLEK